MANVYVYWDKGIDGMPPMIRHMYEHNQYMANLYSFRVNLITDENIYNFIPEDTLPALFWKLAPNHKSDIVRYFVLHEKGGIWLDTDIFIIKDINILFNEFMLSDKDAMLDIEHHTEIGCASLFMKKQTDVTRAAVDTIISLLNTKGTNLQWGDLGPLNIQNIYRLYHYKIHLNSFEKVKSGCNYICYNTIPGIYHSSWYLPSTEEATTIAQALVNNPDCYYIATWNIYRHNNIHDINTMVFHDSHSIFYHISRLSLYSKKKLCTQSIMNIYPSFDHTIPTRLCSIMRNYGSDKGSPDMRGWHNYTTFYDAVFSPVSTSIENVFELGLDTNNTDVPSNMGVNGKPGASHYGWREYFPNAQVYGADIDARILFESDRIKTFYCDQTDPSSISHMWSQIPHMFNIIIEDGLHTFAANKCFFEHSHHKLVTGGVYIIEDIRNEDVGAFVTQVDIWKREMPQFEFHIRELPHHNKLDNRLLVIKKIA